MASPGPESFGFRRRKGSKHDKTGCLTCRHRRKKCVDNVLPICGTCRRLNLKCVRDPIRNVVPALAVSSSTPPPAVPRCPDFASSLFQPPSACPLPNLPNDKTTISQKRHVMGYYITVLTHHLTVSYLPMAMESSVLSDALFAFASGHLALTDPSFHLTALEARSAALCNLAVAVQTSSQHITVSETNAAASLTFLTSEVSAGDSKTWYSHLQGTKDIILSAATTTGQGQSLSGPEAFKPTSEGRWLLRNFAYHDIIGSVTLRRRPLLDGSYLEGITDVVDSYVGVATDLLRFIAQISCLEHDTALLDKSKKKGKNNKKKDDDQKRMSLFHRTCAPLSQQLRDWHCHPDTAPELASMAYAFKSATLIYLYRLTRKRLHESDEDQTDHRQKQDIYDVLQQKIQTNVGKTLDHIADIPVGACPESALLFPLFLAGGEAIEAQHIAQAQDRLQAILEMRRFRNISHALQVLQEVWQRRKEGEDDVDWTQVLDRSSVELLLT